MYLVFHDGSRGSRRTAKKTSLPSPMKFRSIAMPGRYMGPELVESFYRILTSTLGEEPRWQIAMPGSKPLFRENWSSLNAALNGEWGWSLPESTESSALFLRVAFSGFYGITVEFKADLSPSTGSYECLSVRAYQSEPGPPPSSLPQAEALADELNRAMGVSDSPDPIPVDSSLVGRYDGSMFLIDSAAPRAKSEGSSGEGDPEPEAFSGIKRILEEFGPDVNYREMFYLPQSSQLDPLRFDYLLRDIGGATSEARRAAVASTDPREAPMLDGLAINLLKQAAHRHLSPGIAQRSERLRRSSRGIFGNRPGSELSFSELISEISDPGFWRISGVDRPDSLELGYFFTLLRKPQELVFYAQEDEHGVLTIRGARRVPNGNFELRSFRTDLNEIFLDQRKRNILARKFEEAPQVSGFPPKVRSAIKDGLKSLGISHGTYSRLGFSSGRFPFPKVRSSVSGSSSLYLVFDHCDSCGLVRELSIEGDPTREQALGVAALSERIVAPWHSNLCAEHSVSYAEQLAGGL